MEPKNDPQLRSLLKEWKAPAAPASLEQRVLAGHQTWWQFLIRGYVRVPVPVVCCLVVLMGAGVWASARVADKVGSCLAVSNVGAVRKESAWNSCARWARSVEVISRDWRAGIETSPRYSRHGCARTLSLNKKEKDDDTQTTNGSIANLFLSLSMAWAKSPVPRTASELKVVEPSGKTTLLSKQKGQVVLVQFLYTNCQHCQATARLYSKLQKEFGSRGLRVYGVAFNDDVQSNPAMGR